MGFHHHGELDVHRLRASTVHRLDLTGDHRTLLARSVAKLLGPDLLLEVIVVAACFLSFATMAIHPSFLMVCFTMLLAIGWQGFESEKLNLTFWEKLSGETVGVVIAMAAIAFLQWWQNRRHEQSTHDT